jgi:O6-methylguanine-DNA--protein-cysteine methyltransferase
MATNPILIVIPCHRVVGVNNDLTGFGGGLAMKRGAARARRRDVRPLTIH